MTLGPLIAAVGLALLVRVAPGTGYLTTTFPAVVVFGLGLSVTMAPLTWTALRAAGPAHAGVASAINNVVARAAAAVAVATLPVAAGIAGPAAPEPDVFAEGFRRAMWEQLTPVRLGKAPSHDRTRRSPCRTTSPAPGSGCATRSSCTSAVVGPKAPRSVTPGCR